MCFSGFSAPAGGFHDRNSPTWFGAGELDEMAAAAVRFQGGGADPCTLRMPIPRKTGIPRDSIKASYAGSAASELAEAGLGVPAGLCQWVCFFLMRHGGLA